jgi:hypothetical protein
MGRVVATQASEEREIGEMNARRPGWVRSCFAAALGVAAICLAPSAGAAAERVQDGGFEAAICDADECNDSAWVQGVTTAFTVATGPICRAGTGTGTTACTTQGSAPFSGSTWARLGAGYKPNTMVGGGVSSFLDQTIPIPTSPATLSFRLRIINAPGPTGEIRVRAGDLEIFAATDGTPGFASYAPVTIDVSSLAGAAPAFRFEAFSASDPISALDSFDVDDISLTTVDPSPTATVDPRCAKLRAKLKKAKKKKTKRKIRKKIQARGC